MRDMVRVVRIVARLAEHFDSVVVMERGKLVADKAFGDLESNTAMKELLEQD